MANNDPSTSLGDGRYAPRDEMFAVNRLEAVNLQVRLFPPRLYMAFSVFQGETPRPTSAEQQLGGSSITSLLRALDHVWTGAPQLVWSAQQMQ